MNQNFAGRQADSRARETTGRGEGAEPAKLIKLALMAAIAIAIATKSVGELCFGKWQKQLAKLKT